MASLVLVVGFSRAKALDGTTVASVLLNP